MPTNWPSKRPDYVGEAVLCLIAVVLCLFWWPLIAYSWHYWVG
jgi:hypothetical protein